MWELAACKDTRKSVAFADFAEGPTPREARSGVVTPLPTELTIRDARAGAFLEPRGPLTKRTLRVPLSAVAAPRGARATPGAARHIVPTPRRRRGREPVISPRRAPATPTPAAGRATMASFAGSSKDTVADLLVDKSASPPPGAKPAKAPDTEKKHYATNNDGETMEALLEGAFAASRRVTPSS